jgi:hypothetical protein
LANWIPSGPRIPQPDRQWLGSVPDSLDLSGLNEWYESGKVVVAVDREHRIVAYRNWTE